MQSEPMCGLLIYFTVTRHTSKDEAHRTINEQWASKPGCRPECGQWVHLSLGVGQSVGNGFI